MEENPYQSPMAGVAIRNRVFSILACGLAGAGLVGSLLTASAVTDHGLGWVPSGDPHDFACIGACIGATIGVSLIAGWVRWRIVLAALGAVASSFFPGNACDGSLYIVPAFAAFIGGALGLWFERICKPAASHG